MNQNTVCQGPTWISNPPTMGATAGATPKITATWLIIRCAFGPSKRSRMTVRLTIVEPPAASPWATRPTSSHSSVGANAHATDAAAYTTSEPMITGRRPMASDSGPWKRLIDANASMYAVTTSWSSPDETSSASPISVNAGNGVSMLNGPIIESIASTSGMRATARGVSTVGCVFAPVVTVVITPPGWSPGGIATASGWPDGRPRCCLTQISSPVSSTASYIKPVDARLVDRRLAAAAHLHRDRVTPRRPFARKITVGLDGVVELAVIVEFPAYVSSSPSRSEDPDTSRRPAHRA